MADNELFGNSEQLVAKDINVPAKDCISRQAALRIFEEHCYPVRYDHNSIERGMTLTGIVEVLNMTPPAQQWIPWDSGKFPEESGTYTVTAYDGATKRVTYAKYQKRLKRWELTGARAYWRVLAWQPKPKPWEGEPNE